MTTKGSSQVTEQAEPHGSSASKTVLKGIVGAVGLITVLTFASRIIGFIRWIAQASWVGTGSIADAYASANQIPNVLFEVVAGGALAGITIPLLSFAISANLKKDVNKIASTLLTWTLVILIPIAVVVYLLAPWLHVIFPVSAGADQEFQNYLTTLFLRIFAPQIPLYGVGIIFTGILQAHKKFFWPVITPIFSSIVVIATYYYFGYLTYGVTQPSEVSTYAILVLAWGTTLGVFMLSVPMLIPIYSLGVRLYISFTMDKQLVKKALSLGFSGIGALLAQQLSVLVTLYLAKRYGQIGTVNIFQYTQAIYYLPYAILAVPVATALFPYVSEIASKNNMQLYARVCAKSINVVIFLSVIGCCGLVSVSYGVEKVFQQLNNVDGMASTLVTMSAGLIGYGLIFHINRCLYAINASFSAVLATAIGWLCVVGGQVLAVHVLVGDSSDAIATLNALGVGQTIGMSVAAIALIVAVGTKVGSGLYMQIIKPLLKYIPVMIVATFVAMYVSENVFLGQNLLAYLLNAFCSGMVILGAGAISVLMLGKKFFKPSKWVEQDSKASVKL